MRLRAPCTSHVSYEIDKVIDDWIPRDQTRLADSMLALEGLAGPWNSAVVVRQLQPWIANIGKRQVRSPKVYLRDTGTLHRLLGIPSADELLAHPIVGASWEGLATDDIVVAHAGPDRFPMAERIEAVLARELLTWRTLSDAL